MTKRPDPSDDKKQNGSDESYENEKAEDGAPRGYDPDHERYDEDGNRIYRDEANEPIRKEK